MNPFDRMPGPGPRGDHDGLDALHAFGMLVGLTLALLALVLFAMLVWNSFKVRGELRALRGEVARLGGGGTGPLTPKAPGVNHGALAVPPAPPAPPVHMATPPAPPVVAKTPRAPRRKPTGAAE